MASTNADPPKQQPAPSVNAMQTAQVLTKPSALVVADAPLSTTKALLLTIVFPRIHHVYVPPPTPEATGSDTAKDGGDDDVNNEGQPKTDEDGGGKKSILVTVDNSDTRMGKGKKNKKPVVIVDTGTPDNDEEASNYTKKKKKVTIAIDKASSAAKDSNRKDESASKEELSSIPARDKKNADMKNDDKGKKKVCATDADGSANDDAEQKEGDGDGDEDKHEVIGYVEGDDEKGEENVEHVVTAEEMATVVKLPTAAETAAAEPMDTKKMAAEATKKIRIFFGIVNADEDEKPTIHLTKAEAVNALRHENEVVDETPNTAIRVEALLRITFKDLMAEGHLFNAPIYTDVVTTHDDDEEMWCELSVMVKTASVGAVLERLERIGVGSSVGTLAIYKAELCRTAYDYGKPAEVSQRDAATDGADTKSNRSERGTATGAAGDGGGEKSNIEAAKAEWKNAASRLRVEQVKEQIHEQSALSLDFLALLFIASILSGIGLITDSTVVIVASMLVSPIMGPVMGMTFGARVNDWALAKSSAINEGVALLISVGIGAAIGFTSSWTETAQDWPTSEMITRGDKTGLITGICIAIPSGAGVALSILGNNTASLVGVAISASLLPPAVNAGVCWAHGILIRTGAVVNAASEVYSFGQIGGISFALTVVNIVCIWISGIIMFAIKEVAPTKAKSAFWSRDIKVARAQKQDSKKEVDVEVIRKGLSDALEKERQKEQKAKNRKERPPMASRRRRKRLIRKASGPRPEVTFNLAVNPVPIDDISQMDTQYVQEIGLEPLVEPFPVPKKGNRDAQTTQPAPAATFGSYAYGEDAPTSTRPMLVDDVQYVGLEDMAALLGFDDEDEQEEKAAEESKQNLLAGLAGWFTR